MYVLGWAPCRGRHESISEDNGRLLGRKALGMIQSLSEVTAQTTRILRHRAASYSRIPDHPAAQTRAAPLCHR